MLNIETGPTHNPIKETLSQLGKNIGKHKLGIAIVLSGFAGSIGINAAMSPRVSVYDTSTSAPTATTQHEKAHTRVLFTAHTPRPNN